MKHIAENIRLKDTRVSPTETAILEHSIPDAWPSGIERELQRLDCVARNSVNKRLDLRELPFITIDGADARDFDDAVYAHSELGGWKLWVAIADVSYFVQPDSVLDKVAYNRGNSVYFPDRVVPMLPEVLADDLCSLRQGEDRFSLACEIEINIDGSIQDWRFHEATICSHARLTYDAVGTYLGTGRTEELNDFPLEVLKNLDSLMGVYQSLVAGRNKRGSVDFEFSEAKMEYTKEGRIQNIRAVARNDAQRLIEECMLAANVCAARVLEEKHGGTLYRIHEAPATEDVVNLGRLLSGFGLTLGKGRSPTAGDYSDTLIAARAKKDVPIEMLQAMMLRSMRQAAYSSTKGPHFALGYPVYTHFTSPIRRYPDLVVHRLLKQEFGWGKRNKGKAVDLEGVANHCSFTDRRAEIAVRDVLQWLKAEFMQDKVGQAFLGMVSGVTEFGVFVQLLNYLIDGLVHVSELGEEYFGFDPLRQELIGSGSGRKIRLGDRMKVIVARVDLNQGRVDFLPQDDREVRQPGKGRRRVKRRSARSQFARDQGSA